MAGDRPIALVVDDDLMIRMDVIELLESWGFAAFEAESADQAMDVLATSPAAVELLFTDVEMPGSRNGLALARDVAVSWPDIKIVIASGRVQPGPDDLPEGAVFIRKPFSPDVVREHLMKVLPADRRPAPLRE